MCRSVIVVHLSIYLFVNLSFVTSNRRYVDSSILADTLIFICQFIGLSIFYQIERKHA